MRLAAAGGHRVTTPSRFLLGERAAGGGEGHRFLREEQQARRGVTETGGGSSKSALIASFFTRRFGMVDSWRATCGARSASEGADDCDHVAHHVPREFVRFSRTAGTGPCRYASRSDDRRSDEQASPLQGPGGAARTSAPPDTKARAVSGGRGRPLLSSADCNRPPDFDATSLIPRRASPAISCLPGRGLDVRTKIDIAEHREIDLPVGVFASRNRGELHDVTAVGRRGRSPSRSVSIRFRRS